MIPKIIHQTWKTNQIPEEWQAFVKSWKFHHPDWEYKLWTNDDGEEFVERFYPDFLNVYLAYPYDIQRADAIRYLVVYHYGGLYADLDFECLQSFESLRNTNQLVIGYEPQKHAQQHSRQELLCNALFASKPKSTFLKAVIDYLRENQFSTTVFLYDVLKTTGPLMLQTVYEQSNKSSVDVQPSMRFCPYNNNAPELALLVEGSEQTVSLRNELIDSGCYAVHHWANSWISSTIGELSNPTPNEVDGFDFYPMVDSPGMDLFFGGRDILALAEHCRSDARVVAFNTDGFAKHTISDPSAFSPMLNPEHNEGLYVKKETAESDDFLDRHVFMRFINLTNIGPKPFRLFLDEIGDPVISTHIRDNRVWEAVETAMVCKLISPGDVVVDIGAHIGYFTVLFSNLVEERGKVYGFEPEKDNYSLLESNILTNKLENVTIENLALSDKSGEALLYLSNGNKGDHRLTPVKGREEQKVNQITFDQYLQGSQRIDFIKSDTQGHELKVLQGMTQIIHANKEHLCCLLEFAPGLLNSQDPDGVKHFVDFFDSYETKIYWINDKGKTQELVAVDKDALYVIANRMLKHISSDHSCNILVFFSTTARDKYLAKLGI